MKRNKKIFYFFIVPIFQDVLILRKLFYFSFNEKSMPLLSPPGFRPTRIYSAKKDLSPGKSPGPIFRILRHVSLNFVERYVRLL